MFKTGDRVRYVQDVYNLGPHNPLWGSQYQCEGVVISLQYRNGLRVEWDNGKSNSYDLDTYPGCIVRVSVPFSLPDELFEL